MGGGPAAAEGHLELGAGDDAAGDQSGGSAFVVQLDGLVGEDFKVGGESLFIAQGGELGAVPCGIDGALLDRGLLLQHAQRGELVLHIAEGGENLFPIERGGLVALGDGGVHLRAAAARVVEKLAGRPGRRSTRRCRS